MNQDSTPLIHQTWKNHHVRTSKQQYQPCPTGNRREGGRDKSFRFVTHNPCMRALICTKIVHHGFLILTYINSKSLRTTILAAAAAATSYTNICHLQSSAPATTATVVSMPTHKMNQNRRILSRQSHNPDKAIHKKEVNSTLTNTATVNIFGYLLVQERLHGIDFCWWNTIAVRSLAASKNTIIIWSLNSIINTSGPTAIISSISYNHPMLEQNYKSPGYGLQ